MAISSKELENFEWNVDLEVQLFYAMRGHKPVGVNRHFQMACIIEKFRNSIQRDITAQHVWDHLESMYDMAALHESEIIPFPNDEVDFSLPDSILGNAVKKEASKDEEKLIVKTKEVNREEKETSNPPSKPAVRERSKEIREADNDIPQANSPKRKRNVRNSDSNFKSQSSTSSTPNSGSKRRRL